MQPFGPIGGGHARLKQKRADNIVSSTNDPLGFTVLGRRVGALHAKKNVVCEKEGVRTGVVKLATVVTLDSLDAGTE